MTKILKLVKPVTLIITIDIKTWWDKVNTYSSARVTLNNDWENTLYYPCSYNTPDNLASTIKADLVSMLPTKYIPDNRHYQSDWMSKGVYIVHNIINATHVECRRFGLKPE